jgi:hypothetical protein
MTALTIMAGKRHLVGGRLVWSGASHVMSDLTPWIVIRLLPASRFRGLSLTVDQPRHSETRVATTSPGRRFFMDNYSDGQPTLNP